MARLAWPLSTPAMPLTVEQRLKVATGRAKGVHRCEARLAFGESAPKREGVVV